MTDRATLDPSLTGRSTAQRLHHTRTASNVPKVFVEEKKAGAEEKEAAKEEKEAEKEEKEAGDYSFPKDIEKDGPVEIRFAFNVNNIYNIDSVGETYQLDFDICFEWEDDRCSERDLTEGEDSPYAYMKKEGLKWDDAWHPKIEVVSQIAGDELQSEKEIICRKDAEGKRKPKVTWWINSNSTIRSSMDLQAFPFDTQTLHLQFRSSWFHSKQVVFRPLRRQLKSLAGNINPQIVLNEWILKDVKANTNIHVYPMLQELEGETSGVFHNLDISFTVQRKPTYYLTRIASLFAFVVVMSGGSFLLDPTNPGPRVSISITLFLTAVAFAFVIADSLPKISYRTRLDTFVTFQYLFIFISYLENIILYNISTYSTDTTATPRQIDGSLLIVFFFACISSFVWFLIPYFFIVWNYTTWSRDFKADAPVRPKHEDPMEGKAIPDSETIKIYQRGAFLVSSGK